jgi:hypothetical protein
VDERHTFHLAATVDSMLELDIYSLCSLHDVNAYREDVSVRMYLLQHFTMDLDEIWYWSKKKERMKQSKK